MFIHPINVSAARAILRERGTSMNQFLRQGEITLAAGIKMTRTGKCKYQIVDHTGTGGEGVVPFITQHDYPMLPCCGPDSEGSFAERNEVALERRRNEAVVHALSKG